MQMYYALSCPGPDYRCLRIVLGHNDTPGMPEFSNMALFCVDLDNGYAVKIFFS